MKRYIKNAFLENQMISKEHKELKRRIKTSRDHGEVLREAICFECKHCVYNSG